MSGAVTIDAAREQYEEAAIRLAELQDKLNEAEAADEAFAKRQKMIADGKAARAKREAEAARLAEIAAVREELVRSYAREQVLAAKLTETSDAAVELLTSLIRRLSEIDALCTEASALSDRPRDLVARLRELGDTAPPPESGRTMSTVARDTIMAARAIASRASTAMRTIPGAHLASYVFRWL